MKHDFCLNLFQSSLSLSVTFADQLAHLVSVIVKPAARSPRDKN